MRSYVITGATGHLGNVVVRKLVESGCKVKALILPNEDLSPLKDLQIEIAYGDVRDKTFLKNNIDENCVVIHMAGIIDVSSKSNNLLMDVNVFGTKNVADECLEKNARLVYTSSVHTIMTTKNVVLSEPTEFDEKNIVGAYAKSKTIATKYVFEMCKKGLKATVVYPSGIIGPYDFKISDVGQVILSHINGKLFAYVKGGYNFVDVRDVADGVITAVDKGKVGEGYILSGEYYSVQNLISTLNEKLKRKKSPPKLALWFVRLMAPLTELYYRIRKQKPTFSSYSLHTLQDNCNFSHEKAQKELNFNPMSAKQSLFDSVDWLLKNKSDIINKK